MGRVLRCNRATGLWNCSLCTWQVDLESRSESRLAVHPDKAAVLFHNAIDGGQSETGPFSFFLCGVEGFEDVGQVFLRNSESGIGNR